MHTSSIGGALACKGESSAPDVVVVAELWKELSAARLSKLYVCIMV